MRTIRRRHQAGFTLVEMIVAMLLMTVVSLALAGTFIVGYRTISQEARQIAADTAISSATLSLTRDLQSAAAVPTGTITPGVNTLAFTVGSPPVAVGYTIDANQNLIRTVGGQAFVAARGMSSVAIALAGCYSTVTLQPSAAGAAAQTLNVSNRPGGCL